MTGACTTGNKHEYLTYGFLRMLITMIAGITTTFQRFLPKVKIRDGCHQTMVLPINQLAVPDDLGVNTHVFFQKSRKPTKHEMA